MKAGFRLLVLGSSCLFFAELIAFDGIGSSQVAENNFSSASFTGGFGVTLTDLLSTTATTAVTTAAALYGTMLLVKTGDPEQSALDTYVTTNLAALEKDVSQGDGEHLQAFAELVGCEKGPEFSKFKALSKQSQAVIFADSASKNIVQRWRQEVHAEAGTSKCFRTTEISSSDCRDKLCGAP